MFACICGQKRSAIYSIKIPELSSARHISEIIILTSIYLLCFASSVHCLTVRRVPPRFSIPPTNQEVMPGGSVNLTCVAVGSPMPYVKWMMGPVELTKDEEMPMGRNVLEVTNIRESANYTCMAMSSLGVIEATAQVTVKGETSCVHQL